MLKITRREFSQATVAFGAMARGLRGATNIDDTLRLGIERR